jgi:hypothetical protein
VACRGENVTSIAMMNPRLNIETWGTHLNRRADEFAATRHNQAIPVRMTRIHSSL